MSETRNSLSIRPNALAAPASGIVDVADYGRGRKGLIPLWVGEGDEPTPGFITDAARISFEAGETFYTHQAGIPALRETIAAYLGGLYGQPVGAERIFVTSGGMHALQIATTMIAGPGDEVIVPTPAWPNFDGALKIAGATTREVPMHFGNAGWQLDVADIARAITPRTRGIAINSPANPTGWAASREELGAILDLARAHDLWIIADEIYGRFYFPAHHAPSFRDVMRSDDKILFVQTLSKNWAMTGWRLGWLEAPAELAQVIVNLIQYSSSGTPVFAQRAAAAAMAGGEDFIAGQVARTRKNRDILVSALVGAPRIRAAEPTGAFYLFFGVEGAGDSRALAYALIDKAGIGLAPGSAFGKAGNGFLRLCYLRRSEDIVTAAERLSAYARSL